MDKKNKILSNEKPKKVKRPKKPKKTKRIKRVKYKPDGGGSKKNLILIVLAALGVILISSMIFMTLSSLFSTETYYVLNTNVKAKQLITPEMVVARETASGTGPVNAIDMSEIQQGETYSKYPLYAGDVVAVSNAGKLAINSVGIPDGWAETSFSISSTDAVGGILGRGDYVDILGVDEEGAVYIANNLLILEVKFVNEEYDGRLDGQTVVGEAMHYTVGMPSNAIAYFHSALEDYLTIKMVKAPRLLDYAERDVSDLDQVFKYGPEVGNMDLFKGTDPTFTDIERDENGKPINYSVGEEAEINVKKKEPKQNVINKPEENMNEAEDVNRNND